MNYKPLLSCSICFHNYHAANGMVMVDVPRPVKVGGESPVANLKLTGDWTIVTLIHCCCDPSLDLRNSSTRIRESVGKKMGPCIRVTRVMTP
jgi:hypothetical protein